MGTTKAKIFSYSQLRKAKLARALGHPARIAILEYLSAHTWCSTRNLTSEISLSQSTLAQHLKLLKAAGLLNVMIVGKETCYFINDAIWDEEGFTLEIFERCISIK